MSLCSCKKEETINKNFLKPVNNNEVFSLLKKDLHDGLYLANGQSDISNDLLVNFGKELVDLSLYDISGNIIDFSSYKKGKLIIQLSASWCSHCKLQSLEYTDDILKAYPDITFIQLFLEGNKEEIEAFYKEIGKDIPDNIVIIPQQDGVKEAFKKAYDPKYYPTFFIFNDGYLTWTALNELPLSKLQSCAVYCFEKTLSQKDLVNDDNKYIFDFTRTADDLRKEIAENDLIVLRQLDNDDYTETLTLEHLGKNINYSDQFECVSEFESQVSDFLVFNNEKLIVFYLEKAEDQLDILNNFYLEHPEIKMIALAINESDIDIIDNKIDMPLVSILDQVPQYFNTIICNAYPTAVFVDEGIITGAYSKVNSIENLEIAYDLFLGDASLALDKNNS